MKFCDFIFLILICAVFPDASGQSSLEISTTTVDPNCLSNTVDKNLFDNPDIGIGGKVLEDGSGGTEAPGQDTSPSESTNGNSEQSSTVGSGSSDSSPIVPETTNDPVEASSPSTNTVSTILSEILSSSYPSEFSSTVTSMLTTTPSSCSGTLRSAQLAFQQFFEQITALFQQILESFFSALGINNFG
ncbi:DUF148 domain-containing protein [Caenorhabditis elegans]|uniref:DUF148 domain-containing protein n=1 Tax=Caenorhabditis elegans TaxID=6239 RepID=Q9NA66_CAEEL|nr:DUF148 domain-containing protein [Caenorhabditis elegans]CAB54467.2 DUF148 domain-containing protein [Caenorhabditis elegans]|eukprot:NP_502733.2 Uncharacterized protein CELE_Y64G10A.2 [Caenorhabditis elegans]